ncbi:hypothetical protein [Streptomyces sp. ODS28]|uniref:hypothetical protein n=1 Tax=Streptomyces sp. ODS28 TaxID=3136688 RepID=UPI0031EBE5D6
MDEQTVRRLRARLAWTVPELGARPGSLGTGRRAAEMLRFLADGARSTAPADASGEAEAHARSWVAGWFLDRAAEAVECGDWEAGVRFAQAARTGWHCRVTPARCLAGPELRRAMACYSAPGRAAEDSSMCGETEPLPPTPMTEERIRP